MAVIALTTGPARADELAGIGSAPETEADYDRTRDYGSGWQDDDGDCQDARQEVLIAESLVLVTLTANGCTVTAGVWFDPFTGELFTTPFHMDIDHLVPLKEVHDSGAHAWQQSGRLAYANDLTNPGHLTAVDASANRSKGNRDPAERLPTIETFRCAYVLAWTAVKRAWELTMDQAEADAITVVLQNCQ